MRICVIGDIHFKSKNPINRQGSYLEDLVEKLLQVFKVCDEYECDYIVCPGDIFDYPVMAQSTLFTAYQVFAKSPCPIVTVPGNHDIFGYNLASWETSVLKILKIMLQNKLIVLGNEHAHINQDKKVMFFGQGFNSMLDTDPTYGYTVPHSNLERLQGTYKTVNIVHGMLVEGPRPFLHTLVSEINPNVDLLVTGHDHGGFGVIKKGSKLIINPGSLIRSSISEADRYPACVVVDMDEMDYEVFQLKRNKDAFNKDDYDEKKRREEVLETFSTLADLNLGATSYNIKELLFTTIMQTTGLPKNTEEIIRNIMEKHK